MGASSGRANVGAERGPLTLDCRPLPFALPCAESTALAALDARGCGAVPACASAGEVVLCVGMLHGRDRQTWISCQLDD